MTTNEGLHPPTRKVQKLETLLADVAGSFLHPENTPEMRDKLYRLELKVRGMILRVASERYYAGNPLWSDERYDKEFQQFSRLENLPLGDQVQ